MHPDCVSDYFIRGKLLDCMGHAGASGKVSDRGRFPVLRVTDLEDGKAVTDVSKASNTVPHVCNTS
jgi:hypothetical protein